MREHRLHACLRIVRFRSGDGIFDLTPPVAGAEVPIDFYLDDRFAPVASPDIVERIDDRAQTDQKQQTGHHHFLQYSHAASSGRNVWRKRVGVELKPNIENTQVTDFTIRTNRQNGNISGDLGHRGTRPFLLATRNVGFFEIWTDENLTNDDE